MEVEEMEEFSGQMKLLLKEPMRMLERVDERIYALLILPCDNPLLRLIQEERDLHLVHDAGVCETIRNNGFPLLICNLVFDKSLKELYFSVVNEGPHNLGKFKVIFQQINENFKLLVDLLSFGPDNEDFNYILRVHSLELWLPIDLGICLTKCLLEDADVLLSCSHVEDLDD